jgi:acetyl esterase/lipase
VRFDEAVSYRDLGDGKSLKLDVARPAARGPYPTVVLIPGGGWLSKGRVFKRPLQFEMAALGYVAVSIEYRNAPTSPFPTQLHDVKGAVRWLRANAEQYDIDKNRVGVVGYSAGGNIASLMGLTRAEDKLEGEGNANQSSQVSVVVNHYGISDFAALYNGHCLAMPLTTERVYVKFVLDTFLGGPPKMFADTYRKASAVSYARKDAPPFLLLHGTDDQVIPLSQSQALRDRLLKEGGKVTLEEIKGGGHDYAGNFEETANKVMFRFLEQHLKPGK